MWKLLCLVLLAACCANIMAEDASGASRAVRQAQGLSITAPLDVMRERIALEWRRRQQAERQGQIDRNREMLDRIGK